MRRPPAVEGPQQHDLDPAVAERFVAGARIIADEQVLDAGAGLGAIAAALIGAGAKVTCAEFAPERLDELRRRFAKEIGAARLSVVGADLRSWDPGFVETWRVIANPPFHLTAQLVRSWILGPRPPRALDLILQRETAEKLCAPGTRSGALLACAGQATFVARLDRGSTNPPSRVDLAVWRFRRSREADPRELVQLDKLLERAFAGPRTVAEALRGVASAVQLKRQGAEQGWNPQGHPREVPPHAWLPLTRLLAMCGKI
jgi:16S rRNA A1518/A1519 N6-dimethyltransferase RsmA/KsgA/DIM1 with predicted DNA glycosylase/AP lyase activity